MSHYFIFINVRCDISCIHICCDIAVASTANSQFELFILYSWHDVKHGRVNHTAFQVADATQDEDDESEAGLPSDCYYR